MAADCNRVSIYTAIPSAPTRHQHTIPVLTYPRAPTEIGTGKATQHRGDYTHFERRRHEMRKAWTRPHLRQDCAHDRVGRDMCHVARLSAQAWAKKEEARALQREHMLELVQREGKRWTCKNAVNQAMPPAPARPTGRDLQSQVLRALLFGRWHGRERARMRTPAQSTLVHERARS